MYPDTFGASADWRAAMKASRRSTGNGGCDPDKGSHRPLRRPSRTCRSQLRTDAAAACRNGSDCRSHIQGRFGPVRFIAHAYRVAALPQCAWLPSTEPPTPSGSGTRYTIFDEGTPLEQRHLLLASLFPTIGSLLSQRDFLFAHCLTCGCVRGGAVRFHTGHRCRWARRRALSMALNRNC
jgi:hypothetical protein